MPQRASTGRPEASLAKRLHTGPLQDLSAAVLRLEYFRLVNDSQEMQSAIADVEGHIRTAIASLREIIEELTQSTSAESTRR